jgi:hypothetical protein
MQPTTKDESKSIPRILAIAELKESRQSPARPNPTVFAVFHSERTPEMEDEYRSLTHYAKRGKAVLVRQMLFKRLAFSYSLFRLII